MRWTSGYGCPSTRTARLKGRTVRLTRRRRPLGCCRCVAKELVTGVRAIDAIQAALTGKPRATQRPAQVGFLTY